MQRRHLLQAAAALALARLTQPVAAQFGVAPNAKFTSYPFSLGVASGMPRPTSVVLWTRLAPEPLAADGLGGLGPQDLLLKWQVADDAAFTRIVARGDVRAYAANAHSVRVTVAGLQSARAYFYRFISLDAVSPTGRTRTAPAEGAIVNRLRFALASCMHYEGGYFSALRDLAERELDFVLFCGDYMYESNYGANVRLRSHETATEPTTLLGYRRRYAHIKQDADLQAAHHAHPWIMTWDDHEVDNDYAADESQDFERGSAFLQRRAAAYKAYFEHQPFDESFAPQGPDMRIYERYAWGQLAELWTLDARQYRSYHACPSTRHGNVVSANLCPDLAAPERTLLGGAQERWLQSGLKASERQWKLLGQQTIMAQTAELTSAGRMTWNEGWDGYSASRDRLMDTVAEHKLADVVSLAGDVHMHVAADLKRRYDDKKGKVIASEFVASSLTSRGREQAAWDNSTATNPHLKHLRSDERGYALLDITPQIANCDFLSTPHPVRADAKLAVQARFAVQAGVAGVEKA